MNKYIYKVRFVTLYNKNICINMNYFLANNNSFNNRKIDCRQIVENYDSSCLFSQKFHFLTSDHETSLEDDLTANFLF